MLEEVCHEVVEGGCRVFLGEAHLHQRAVGEADAQRVRLLGEGGELGLTFLFLHLELFVREEALVACAVGELRLVDFGVLHCGLKVAFIEGRTRCLWGC